MLGNSSEIQGNSAVSEVEVKNHNFEDTIKHFKLEEDYSQNPEKYKEMKEDFEKYLLINLKMDLLEEHVDDTIDTTDKKIVALKNYMEKISKKAKTTDIKVPTSIEEAKEVAWNNIIKRFVGQFPKFSNILLPITWFLWGWFSVGLFDWFKERKEEGWFFWWIIGKFGFDKELEKGENQIANLSTTKWDKVEDIVESVTTTPQKSEENTESVNEVIDISKYQYLVWYELLLGLSWVTLENNIGTKNIWEQLFDINYNDFLEQRNDADFKNKMTESNNKSLGQYQKVAEALSSEKVHTLLRVGLSWEMVKSILIENDTNTLNDKFVEEFWEKRLNKILDIIASWTYDYAKLSIWEIWMLYSATIPAIWNSTLSSAAGWFSKWVQNIMWIWSEFIQENQEKSFFSETFIQKVGVESWKWEQFNWTEDQLINKFQLTEGQDIEDMKNLNNFKDYIVSEAFIGNDKLMLSSEQRVLLESKLNYKWMIALYGVMWGNKLEEISPVNIPLIVWLLNKIMATGNNPSHDLMAANYLSGFWKELLIPWQTSVFTEDERAVFDIYKEKILDMTILSYMKEINGIIWLAINSDDLLSTWVTVWVAWLWVRYLGKKSTQAAIGKKRYPFLGKIATKLGWAWIIWWGLLWGLSIVSDNSDIGTFDRELEAAYNSRDIEKVIAILEKWKESIKTYEKWEKEVKVVAYEWASPYVIYDKKVYSVEVLPTQNSIEDSGAFKYGFWVALSMLWVSRDSTIEWEHITNIRSQGENIIFWNSWKSIPIETLMTSDWEDRIVDTSFVEKMNGIVKAIDPDYQFLNWKRGDKVYNVWSLSWWEFLIGLVPMDIELKTIEAAIEA